MNARFVILAAGKGSRMKSQLPKVLQPLAKKPLLAHVLNGLSELSDKAPIVVYGHGGDQVKAAFSNQSIQWICQTEQKGTGHAVQMTSAELADDDIVTILYGDVPLVKNSTLERLQALADKSSIALLTVTLENPTGYGRIVREDGQIKAIVEHKDATDAQHQIKEVNTGIMSVRGKELKKWLSQLDSNNAQGELYLTDIVAMACEDNYEVLSVQADCEWDVAGVNDKSQLAELERIYQQRKAKELMIHGVTLLDPSRVDIRGKVSVGNDVEIDVNVVFEGAVKLGSRVKVGPNCVLKDCEIGDDCVIEAYSHIDSTIMGNVVSVGPYARLRPGTELGDNSKIGNFVETKKAVIGAGSKVNHLSYIGDTQMGSDVNIGAGTITCNYDGVNKHQTIIGDNVFVGSDSQLVAPVEIGSGATIGAGSTITKDAPEELLTLSRSKQLTIKNWTKPNKK